MLRHLAIIAGLGLALAAPGPASAARIRYLYGPDPAGGALRPTGQAERLGLLGWEPYGQPPPRATQVVTFRHPCTGASVNVPLYLPADEVPRMEYVRDRTVYNYGSYTVEVRFLPDGAVYVIYNSGAFREPWPR